MTVGLGLPRDKVVVGLPLDELVMGLGPPQDGAGSPLDGMTVELGLLLNRMAVGLQLDGIVMGLPLNGMAVGVGVPQDGTTGAFTWRDGGETGLALERWDSHLMGW